MLSFEPMQRARVVTIALLLAAALGGCGPDEPQFGAAGVILGKPLPKEPITGGAGGGVFGADYDPDTNKRTTTMLAAHQGKGGPTVADDRIDCMTCHIAGGAAAAVVFSYGGGIMNGTTPAANADIIVLNGDTKLGPVKSDTDGFFWFAGPAVAAGAKTHVRSAAGVQSMSTPLGAGVAASCDSANCHVPGKQGKITVP